MFVRCSTALSVMARCRSASATPTGIAAGRFLVISGGVTPVLKSHIHPEVSARERPALARDVVKDDCRQRAALAPILRGMIRYRDAQEIGESR